LERGTVLVNACFSEMDQSVTEAAPAKVALPKASRLSVLQGGVLQYEARQYAPQLQRVLAELPLAHIPHQAPDVEVIALAGTLRLPRHYGRSNSRCSVLFNPAQSAALEVIVGGEKRVLNAGQSLVFDASFGVEYANSGARPVRALSVEAWHPDLSESEQQALCALISAAVDFDTHLQDLN
jgi:hypothetical protein